MAIIKKCKIMNAKDSVQKKGGGGNTPKDPEIPILGINMENQMKMKSLSCVQLCSPMDCSPQGYFIHGIFQARVLEWVAISFSRDLSNTGLNLGLPH